jgi:hypothetical protein
LSPTTKNKPLKEEKIKWKSDIPLTGKQDRTEDRDRKGQGQEQNRTGSGTEQDRSRNGTEQDRDFDATGSDQN